MRYEVAAPSLARAVLRLSPRGLGAIAALLHALSGSAEDAEHIFAMVHSLSSRDGTRAGGLSAVVWAAEVEV